MAAVESALLAVGKAVSTRAASLWLAPIEVGDLLTTSPTPGHAMKAIDPARSFGAVLGKALRSFDQGKGLVAALVSLR
jgi:hypothetical protein